MHGGTRTVGGQTMLLLRAAHIGPTAAVTAVSALLARAVGHDLLGGLTVTAAVLAGQLTIGWSNDLFDARRDRLVHRADKPLATGDLAETTVRVALGLAVVATVVLSAGLGPAAAGAHLLLVVGSGWLYNLVLKSSTWSWLPYAVAFGALPSVVTLALERPALAPSWMTAAGALLGIGAHLLNVLPDLDDDAATGVRGFPHRLGARRARTLATTVLVLASVVVVVPQRPVPAWAWAALAATLVLAAVAFQGRGRAPFRAAMAIAVVDVALLATLA